MLSALRKNIISQKVPSAGDLVVVGVSGGRDSVALLHGLHILGAELGFAVAAAHFNHGIRGGDADADQRLVEDFCREQKIDCFCRREDVPALAAGGNLEAAARKYRYGWLWRLAAELREKGGFDRAYLATAHPLEDQAESVLLHLLHGAGTDGLSGMRMQNGNLLRPLLNVPRALIEDYIRQNDLPYRDDMSNFSTEYKRNKIRLELMPALKEYNVNIAAALANTADICGADSDFIADYVRTKTAALVKENSKGYFFDKKEFDKLHLAVQRRMVRFLWRQAVLLKKPATGGIEENLALTNLQTANILELGGGKQISLPREVYAKVQKGKMYIGKLPDEGQQDDFPFDLKKNSKNR